MKYQVRRGVYETNSSSTHVLTILSKEDYERWNNSRDCYLCQDTYSHWYKDKNDAPIKNKVYTYDEIKEFAKKANKDTFRMIDKYGSFISADNYDELLREYEYEEHNFTTPSGDEMVALCYYGYN